jgi:hypothetical protein
MKELKYVEAGTTDSIAYHKQYRSSLYQEVCDFWGRGQFCRLTYNNFLEGLIGQSLY